MAPGKEEKEKKRGPEWEVRLPDEPTRLRRSTPFICNIRFKNDLPEIPGDPKLLLPPYNKEGIAAFKLTELEKDLKRDLLFEPDLGIPIHAWNIEQYTVPAGKPPPLHPEDAALLESDTELDPRQARLRGDAAEVSWLMRTKYIAAEAGLKRGVGARKPAPAAAAEEEEQEDPRAARVRQIEAQFVAAKAPLVHCKDPSLTPVEVLPVYPDAFMEGRSCVMATFDNDPLQDVEHVVGLPPAERARMSQAAQLKSFKPPGGKQFVALLVPQKLPPQGEGEGAAPGGVIPGAAFAQDYHWVREYHGKVRLDDTGTTFVFRFAGDGTVQFYDLNTRLDLRKRKRGGPDEEEGAFQQPEKVIIRLPGTYDAEAEAAAAEEEERQQRGAPGSEDQQQQEQQAQAEAGDEQGTAGGGSGGSDAEMADADAGGRGGGGGGSEDGGADANARIRDVFGSDDDDI